MSEHIPVLLYEVIDGLNIKENGIYVDCTLGRGGHSTVILSKLGRVGKLIGIDQDEEAINECEKKFSKKSKSITIVRDNFVNLSQILKKEGTTKVDGILLDLGVSSPQFDESERGFSYRYDAPLDMRMDQRNLLTAKDIVNNYREKDLINIFKEYGEEKYAVSIARNIVKERTQKPIETTNELVEIVKRSKPNKELKKPGHPAKQVFQALRIAVNDELNVLRKVISQALEALKSGGRLAIITFHSGEDRIVKEAFKKATTIQGNRLNIPTNTEETEYVLVNKKPITATEDELKTNHRSSSAKLRIIERK